MIIVGVGCGPGMLTQEAIHEISRARLIYGSVRAIDIAREFISPECKVSSIEDYSKVRELPDAAVILSTGDPMLAGLGFPGARIVPGISSMQVAFARLGISLSGASVVVTHGKDPKKGIKEAGDEANRGKTVFIISDPDFSVRDMARYLSQNGPNLDIVICQDLGYPGEKINIGTTALPPETGSRLFCVIVGRFKGPMER